MAKPSRVYYVEQTGAKLRYGQKGGGLFAALAGVIGRRDMLRQSGAEVKMYFADVVWTEFEDKPYVPCEHCKGDGRLYNILSPQDDPIDCYKCNGTGNSV